MADRAQIPYGGVVMVSRRALMTGALGVAGAGGLAALALRDEPAPTPAPERLTLRIDDSAPGSPISPWIYGSGDSGNWDKNGQSVLYDMKALPTIRRLGGNMFTNYNWRNNAANAGADWRHMNGSFLLDDMDIPKEDWNKPAAVIEKFLEHSAEVGTPSLVDLPIAGFVAADFDGVVEAKDAAPSKRFLPVDWSAPGRGAKGAVNIPELVALLKARHGGAAQGGVRGYYLDNEPGLWPQTHPRIMPRPVTIKALIERSLRAALAIKSIDPDAWVIGPASWGATEFNHFVRASDWPDYKKYGSFLGAYLDAFRVESEKRGLRLLDHMDVHWYPQARAGDIYRSEKPEMSQAILDAPRSLDEAGFCEQSWVADELGCGRTEGITLPLLPSLRAAVDQHYPGTGVAIGEYNYGGASLPATGLAIADALGRFGRNGLSLATHWGSLDGYIGEAFRLYRMKDAVGQVFGATALPFAGARESEIWAEVSAFAARGMGGETHLIVLNKRTLPVTVAVSLRSGRVLEPLDALGFDAQTPVCGPVEGPFSANVLRLPPRAARRFRLV